MDAFKKFLNKKKADSKFKQAGPGHRLTDSTGTAASTGGGHSRRQSGGSTSVPSRGGHSHARRSPPEEKKLAAQAALMRLEKNKKPEPGSKELLASRQAAFIREQARKELEAERKLKEEEAQAASKEKTPARTISEPDYTMNAADATVKVDPEKYAVEGVYFTCPLIGPYVLPRKEIIMKIEEFLHSQPEEDIGLTSCLLIYSCNSNRDQVQTAVDTLCKYLDNIIGNPDESKFRKVRCGNKVFQEKILPVKGSLEFLTACHFVKTTMKPDENSPPEDFWVFNPPANEPFEEYLKDMRDMLKSTTPILPEIDRNVQVLMPVQVKARKELPPEFYCLTKEEILREQALRKEIAERELTLRTKAQREKDELREQRLYRYCVMRIRFPDGLTLQGTFKASENSGDLYSFVRENLLMEDVEFSLRKSGTKAEKIPEGEETLAEMHLPPASIVNFKLETPVEGLSSGELAFLKPEIMALVSNPTVN